MIEPSAPRGRDACPTYPGDVCTLVGVLRWQRERMPARIVCHRVVRRRRALVAVPLTVAELWERAERAAGAIAGAGVRPGDRVVLSLSDPHDFLVAFAGTLFAGGLAVPLPTVG